MQLSWPLPPSSPSSSPPVSGATLAARANVKAVSLDVVNAQLAPDGFSRSTIVANGTYPGPPITAIKGQTSEPTRQCAAARRWILTESSSAARTLRRGTPFVTTCPIAPGASYTYDMPLGDQTGTFWYHSQLSVQYVDGLRGPLIIYDPLDPNRHLYDVDDLSTIIQLGDWWHTSTLPLLSGYEATGIVPVSDSGTVNGAGRYNGGSESARNVFTFSIDSHSLTIIEADGVNTAPKVVDTIEMLAGQRYSVVVAANQPIGNYWINAPFVGGSPARNLNQNSTLSRAILRYTGAPIADPVAPMSAGPANGVSLVEADLRPLHNGDAPGVPDVNITLDLQVVAGKAIWNVNNISYVHPTIPTLSKVLMGANDAASFDPTENTFILPAHKTIQIEFPPTDDDDAHPLHLHGGNFHVVKSMSSPDVNVINPIRRDVVGVGGSGTIIRFRTDNPGPWFFHCHIFWHMQAGLATVMLSSPADIRKNVHPSKAWNQLCPAYNALPAELQ
ncbi:Cu-oxidase-domain-containing protein [Infundibulicybe gibba]|nr:Cu-oxidase-domain-containing protein [Infundibulicybe gibba]